MPPQTQLAPSRRAAELESSLRRVIRGKDDVLRLALVSIFAKGHLLIEGVPGVGGLGYYRTQNGTASGVPLTNLQVAQDYTPHREQNNEAAELTVEEAGQI